MPVAYERQVGALHNGRDALLRCTVDENACGDKRRSEGEPPYGRVHKGMRIPTPVTRSLALIDILFGKTEPRGVRRGALFVYAYTQFSCTGSSGFCSTVTRISPVRWLSTRVTCTRSP